DVAESDPAIRVRAALENLRQGRVEAWKMVLSWERLEIHITWAFVDVHRADEDRHLPGIEACGDRHLPLERLRRSHHDSSFCVEGSPIRPFCRTSDTHEALGDSGVEPAIIVSAVVEDCIRTDRFPVLVRAEGARVRVMPIGGRALV